MAKLIPRIDVDEIENKPERDTARALIEQLPDDAVVFHSYPWLRTENQGTRLSQIKGGEADFVVFIWDLGFLVLEVKGGEIFFDTDNSAWFRILPNYRKEIKDPFKQAQTNLHIVKEKIQNAVFPSLPDLPLGYGYAVVFPDCNYTGDVPPGATPLIVLSSNDLSSFDRRIPEIINSWKISGRPLTELEAKKMIGALISSFNLVPVLSRQIEEEYDKLVRLTEEQAHLLDILERHDRCLIEGVAGSGKTMLAMERARRFAEAGKRTLLVCYNITLAAWLSQSLSSEEKKLIDVFHFHGLCEDICRKAGLNFSPSADLGSFYRDVAPEKLLEGIDIIGSQYDALVVDEGQDFHESWWLPLELLCHKADQAPLFIFYDPAQNLFVEELVLPEIGEPFLLKNNCRNTRNIAKTCAGIRDVEIDTHWAAPEGKHVHVKCCPDPLSQRKKAAGVLKQFRKGGLQANQIAILSPYTHRNKKYSFFGVEKLDKYKLTDSADEWQEGKGVLYATIKSFKGLEADAVILVDIPDPDKNKYFTVNDLYVGASRAKHFLTILTRDKFIEESEE
jgi:hypothetical protein